MTQQMRAAESAEESMRTPGERRPVADGFPQHRVALLEKASLGGAAVAFAIILSLGAKDGTLDFQLKLAIGFAVAAMPVLLAVYVAKDAMVVWKNQTESAATTNLNRVASGLVLSLVVLCLAIACIVWHVLGWYGAEATFLWLAVAVVVGVTVDVSVVGQVRQSNGDGQNTG